MLSDATLVVRPGPHHGSAPSVSRRRQHALRTTVAASIRLGDFGTTCGTSALFDLTDECGRQQADVSSKPRWSPKGIAAASQCRRSPALRQHDGDSRVVRPALQPSCLRRPRLCLMMMSSSRQRSAPSATHLSCPAAAKHASSRSQLFFNLF